MSAIVDLQVREAKDVLVVPTSAVVRDGADDVVFVVDGDERAGAGSCGPAPRARTPSR